MREEGCQYISKDMSNNALVMIKTQWRRGESNPLLNSPNYLIEQPLTENHLIDLSTGLAFILQKHPDLKQILQAWETLPEHIKQSIESLVQAHSTEVK